MTWFRCSESGVVCGSRVCQCLVIVITQTHMKTIGRKLRAVYDDMQDHRLKGLNQGYTLTLYLFNLVMDVLGHSITVDVCCSYC